MRSNLVKRVIIWPSLFILVNLMATRMTRAEEVRLEDHNNRNETNPPLPPTTTESPPNASTPITNDLNHTVNNTQPPEDLFTGTPPPYEPTAAPNSEIERSGHSSNNESQNFIPPSPPPPLPPANESPDNSSTPLQDNGKATTTETILPSADPAAVGATEKNEENPQQNRNTTLATLAHPNKTNTSSPSSPESPSSPPHESTSNPPTFTQLLSELIDANICVADRYPEGYNLSLPSINATIVGEFAQPRVVSVDPDELTITVIAEQDTNKEAQSPANLTSSNGTTFTNATASANISQSNETTKTPRGAREIMVVDEYILHGNEEDMDLYRFDMYDAVGPSHVYIHKNNVPRSISFGPHRISVKVTRRLKDSTKPKYNTADAATATTIAKARPIYCYYSRVGEKKNAACYARPQLKCKITIIRGLESHTWRETATKIAQSLAEITLVAIVLILTYVSAKKLQNCVMRRSGYAPRNIFST